MTLYIYRGLPGSGKSTHAAAWVAQDPQHRARVNRDCLRTMLHGGHHDGATERQVTTTSHAAILHLLRTGIDVACDDTNLRQRVVRDLAALARKTGADFHVRDFTQVRIEDCIRRDAKRDPSVGEAVIRGMFDRYLRGKRLPLPLPDPTEITSEVRPYQALPGMPRAALVDVDGTVALLNGRSPFDETHVGSDLPNLPVIEVVRALHAAGVRIVFMSGRSSNCRAQTEKWLNEHVRVAYDALHMRRAGDHRKDAVVKAELFDAHIRALYDITCVLDDRKQVVAMWRALTLTVLQVAEGDF